MTDGEYVSAVIATIIVWAIIAWGLIEFFYWLFSKKKRKHKQKLATHGITIFKEI